MAKRTSLTQRRDRDGDPRGTDVLFGNPENTENASPTENNAGNAADPALATPPEIGPGKNVLSKVTLYIRPDQVLTIETIQLVERQKTGNKPDKSTLVQEALDLLREKYGLT